MPSIKNDTAAIYLVLDLTNNMGIISDIENNGRSALEKYLGDGIKKFLEGSIGGVTNFATSIVGLRVR